MYLTCCAMKNILLLEQIQGSAPWENEVLRDFEITAELQVESAL